jgi:hypothetical protein
MPKLILTSKRAIWDDAGNPRLAVVEALRQAHQSGCQTFVVSNHRPPKYWHDFGFLKFNECGFSPPRRAGEIVGKILGVNRDKGLQHRDIIVLGADDEDMLMAVNSRSLLIRCEWATPLPDKISRYGVPFLNPSSLPTVLRLLEGRAPWYFIHPGNFLDVFAQTNAGTKYETDAKMIRLVDRLRSRLKTGSIPFAKSFTLHFLSSVYNTEGFEDVDVWSYYPNSDSDNDESEIIATFSNQARITYKKRSNGPLFIRHKKSPRRHLGGGDRTDPTLQLETIHLNPAYKNLSGKTVAVLDDYLTYGVSFGVAAAILQAAGAKKVIAIALGKFGACAKCYNITVNSDPFSPLKDFSIGNYSTMTGEYHAEAQTEFLNKFDQLV